MTKSNAYAAILEAIFKARRKPGKSQVDFSRADISDFARDPGLSQPKNLGVRRPVLPAHPDPHGRRC